MDSMEIIKSRHSVRRYNGTPLSDDEKAILKEYIAQCNSDGDLNIQLVTGENSAFDVFMSHYGKFENVESYIALIGKKSSTLSERLGYYGEKIVLKATEMGLGTCWVGISYSKKKCPVTVARGESFVMVIAIGHSDDAGHNHKSKTFEELTEIHGETPSWFKTGMEAVMLAPTAMNQQKFTFLLESPLVKPIKKHGFYTGVDLGIAKLHFELGAGKDNFKWKR